jgi:hypothetical protein
VVEVFHTPVLSDDFTDLSSCFAAVFMGGAKQADRHFGLGSFFGRAVDARAFDDLSDVWKRADFGVHRNHGDVSNLKSPMAALQLSHQIHGTVFKKLLGVFVVVFLVFFDGGKIFTAEFKD